MSLFLYPINYGSQTDVNNGVLKDRSWWYIDLLKLTALGPRVWLTWLIDMATHTK